MTPAEMRQQEEDARRRYLTTILDAAITTMRGRELEDPDGELLSLLDDFFTRAVVFPDPHTGGVRPRPHQVTFGWTSEPPGIQHASHPGRALARFLLAYLDHHGLSLVQTPAAGYRGSHEPASQSSLALSADDPDPGVSTAMEALATRAWHSYGIALHYTGEYDRNGAEATMEAMRHAVQAVAPGFTVAALVRLADDPQLGLTPQQRLYLDHLAIDLDLETLEALHGADPGTSEEGRAAGAAAPAAHLADVRHVRADLVRLKAFVRETVLPRTHPNTTARRRVLEALGEAGGLCTARTVNSDGDVIVCTLDAGHYNPDDKPPFKDGKPGGWHKADTSIWCDSFAASTPHRPPVTGEELGR